jgi:DNA-binding transcriptional LysR family regulator
MHKSSDRGVQAAERIAIGIDTRLRTWDGARALLEVVRSGSFRAASHELRTSANTLRRQIEVFEREIGMVLLTRHVDGVRLTEEGELVAEMAKRMESASFDIARVRKLGVAVDGDVRLSITEGLGTFWVAPRLVEFQEANPGLLIDMRCAMHPADVLRLETDVAIQITPPTAKDLRVVKLGHLHAMLFASPRYLETRGHPRSISELRNHRLVLQVSDQLTSVEQFRQLFPDRPQVGFVSFRTNVSSTHYWVIARGAGIGALPTYATVLGGKVEPVDIPGLRFSHEIWLTYHPDVARIPRVRRLIDWLIEAFSSKRYPWFAEEFIHPRDLPDHPGGADLPALFQGFDGVR